MGTKIKISVIIPVYNVEKYIRDCLDSVIHQSYQNIEVLIVDDGSTDNSGRICDEYSVEDNRVTVFHTDNRGLSAARNTGLEQCKGELIYFIDSDDWMELDVLEKAVTAMEDADILCFSRYSGTYSGVEALSLLINNKIGPAVWAKLYRKNCFKDLRFPVGHIHEDTATTYKLLYEAVKVICADIQGHHYRKRIDSITHTHDLNNLIDYYIAVKQEYEYCKGLLDYDTQIGLLKTYATAISRAWGWKYINENVYSVEWDNMSKDAKRLFPRSVRKEFPLRLRGGLFLARFNHPLSFWIAYKAHMLTRMQR